MKPGARAEAPHAPERGRVARLLGPFHVTGVFWYRVHLFGARIAPFWIRPPFIFAFTCFFFVALRKIRARFDVALAVAEALVRGDDS